MANSETRTGGQRGTRFRTGHEEETIGEQNRKALLSTKLPSAQNKIGFWSAKEINKLLRKGWVAGLEKVSDCERFIMQEACEADAGALDITLAELRKQEELNPKTKIYAVRDENNNYTYSLFV